MDDDQDHAILSTTTSDDIVDFEEEAANEDIIEAIFGKEEAKEFRNKSRGASLSSLVKLENTQVAEPQKKTKKEDNSEIIGEIVFFFAGNRKILEYCYLSERIEELECGAFVNIAQNTLKNGISRMLGPRLEDSIFSYLGTEANNERVVRIISDSATACLEPGAIFESTKDARDWLNSLQDKALILALSRGVKVVKDLDGEELERFYALNIFNEPDRAQDYIESMGLSRKDEDTRKCAYSGFANILKQNALDESNDYTQLDWYYDLFDFDENAQEFLNYMHSFISKEDKGRVVAKYFEEYIINRDKENGD